MRIASLLMAVGCSDVVGAGGPGGAGERTAGAGTSATTGCALPSFDVAAEAEVTVDWTSLTYSDGSALLPDGPVFIDTWILDGDPESTLAECTGTDIAGRPLLSTFTWFPPPNTPENATEAVIAPLATESLALMYLHVTKSGRLDPVGGFVLLPVGAPEHTRATLTSNIWIVE